MGIFGRRRRAKRALSERERAGKDLAHVYAGPVVGEGGVHIDSPTGSPADNEGDNEDSEGGSDRPGTPQYSARSDAGDSVPDSSVLPSPSKWLWKVPAWRSGGKADGEQGAGLRRLVQLPIQRFRLGGFYSSRVEGGEKEEDVGNWAGSSTRNQEEW